MENYDVLSFVGEGSFGRVFKAKHKNNHGVVALKVIRKKGRSLKDLKSLKQECEIQRQLKHPNIILMIDSFDTDSELVVVTEYAEKELHNILAKEGCLDEDRVKKITWDLVSALYYLHSHRVLHRDLKPQNVLLDRNNCAKLCDFGLARIMTNATHILTSIKGTPLYMAPELMEEKPYDHQADLWSLGCIVYELIAGQPPFCTTSILQLVQMVKTKPVQWPSFISTEVRTFLQGLLHKDPLKRMTWPEILDHSYVAGHVLILPSDVQSESPFTKPLSQSQMELKKIQTEKVSNATRLAKMYTETRPPEKREHDLTNIKAVECIPMSDDDSVRATSAFSVRDSLRTDDEDTNQPITAANAKLLRHEYNIMNHSNLVICNLENNMAQFIVNKKPDIKQDVKKMDQILEEKQEIVAKNLDTASQSLDNPKSTTKSDSDVSSGLSKSVPPSYKQKLLQFSREKLRFGSGSLTKSLKRSFTFNRSWDKNKSEQRRISEPVVPVTDSSVKGLIDGDKLIDKTDDKRESVEDLENDKDVDDKAKVKEPTAIELEEWEAFINSNINEVMEGDVESLTQLNMVLMIVKVLESASVGGVGGRACGSVASLLALPPVAPSLSRHTLLDIQDVYLEAKVVYHFVAAINNLLKGKKNDDEGAEERILGATRMLEVISWLCVRSCRAVRQFATAVDAHSAHGVFNRLIKMGPKTPRIALNLTGIMVTVLQDLPEHADVIERILFDDTQYNFLVLLDQPNDALRMRVCILISLLCTFSCTALSVAMETKWSKRDSDRLEQLHSHCNVTLNRAAKLATKELSNMPFFVC